MGNKEILQSTNQDLNEILSIVKDLPIQVEPGSNVIIDGVKTTQDLNLVSTKMNVSVSTLPYNFYKGCAVIYDNELHILGGYNNSIHKYTKYHYKWDGSTWVKLGTVQSMTGTTELPIAPREVAVSCNGKIHVLGDYDNTQRHYVYDGTKWSTAASIPYYFYDGCAVVLNNEIHILGSESSGNKNHYKYNGSSWVSVSTLPYEFYYGDAVVLNNEIHILGGYSGGYYYNKHYKWNGSSWVSVSTLPYRLYENGHAVVLNNEIHIIGSGYESGSTNPDSQYHYKWDGSTWVKLNDLIYPFAKGSAIVYENTIHILGGLPNNSTTYSKYHYAIDQIFYKNIG